MVIFCVLHQPVKPVGLEYNLGQGEFLLHFTISWIRHSRTSPFFTDVEFYLACANSSTSPIMLSVKTSSFPESAYCFKIVKMSSTSLLFSNRQSIHANSFKAISTGSEATGTVRGSSSFTRTKIQAHSPNPVTRMTMSSLGGQEMVRSFFSIPPKGINSTMTAWSAG